MRNPLAQPQTAKIAVTLDNGSLVVLSYVVKGWFSDGIRDSEPTPENINAEIARYAWAPRVERWRLVSDEEIPERTPYRDAIRDQGGTITHCMETAREIHRNLLRKHRAARLAALDVEYQRADEQGDGGAKRRIAEQKQALRDVTAHPDIEAAQTVEELARVRPI